MKIIAAQYLEYAPRDATPARVRRRLHEAFALLPISTIILGWNLPPRLEDAVAEETARQGAELYRWHPLLASDAGFRLPAEWQPINLQGESIPGFKDLPEFTFICPNRMDVQEWIAERVEVAAQRGIYGGLFFDRMRFPSPVESLEKHLGCFCKYCQRVASDSGVDLETIRRQIRLSRADHAERLAQALFRQTDDPLLEAFFKFRSNSITQIVQYAAKLAGAHELKIGFDCFSPTLTRMVGQDLSALNQSCDWIKLMTYPRVFGPAGLPFELRALAEWLKGRYDVDETEAAEAVGRASGLRLGMSGLDSETVAREIRRGRDSGISNLFAGLALVEVTGIHSLTPGEVHADLAACQGADGLVLSWDLWHIPRDYISAVADFATG